MEMQLKAPTPEANMKLIDNGLELMVRYPVDIPKTSQIDDQVTRILLELVNNDPDLKATVGSTPKIRAAIKG